MLTQMLTTVSVICSNTHNVKNDKGWWKVMYVSTSCDTDSVELSNNICITMVLA